MIHITSDHYHMGEAVTTVANLETAPISTVTHDPRRTAVTVAADTPVVVTTGAFDNGDLPLSQTPSDPWKNRK
ncbi:hypothetical protein G3M48_002145 [Beauveria asiatica]|uniref:Uncharacterized protein n=1 Tax=Beauveria asiatica TaxID=1069075 RepID=A0AAW0S6Z9_9HYPO